MIAAKFCTWHDSCAVMSCANIWAISWAVIKLCQYKFSIKFEFWAKHDQWNRPPGNSEGRKACSMLEHSLCWNVLLKRTIKKQKKTPVICQSDVECLLSVQTGSLWCYDRSVNMLRARQNGRHFAGNIFKWISFSEHFIMWNKISLKYFPWGLIDTMSALV